MSKQKLTPPAGVETNKRLMQMRSRLEAESGDSLKLSKDLKDNSVCSVTLDESVPCILVIWKRYATSTQLRFIHECILELIRGHGIGKVLGDDTRLPTIAAEDQRWIVEDWMPRAKAAGLKFCCSKSPHAHFGKVAVSNIQSIVPSGLIARRFDTVDEAKDWLRDARVS